MEELRPEVIFEDNEILVLNKPAGLVTTSEGVKSEFSVENWLIKNYQNSISLARAGIVHRLDKGTCGLLLVAKDQEALVKLKAEFKARNVIKKYLALVSGNVPMRGTIQVPISRSKVFGKWRVGYEGKGATTDFVVLDKYRDNVGKIFSLLELSPKTGRTHQIRVHCAYMGWPLWGDKTYGGQMSGMEHPFLQAKYLEFMHPKTRETKAFEIGLENELKVCLGGLSKV